MGSSGGGPGAGWRPAPGGVSSPPMHFAELVALERALRGKPTLSVYLDGAVTTPAARTAWRRRLECGLDHLRAGIADDERAAFAAATSALADLLAPFTGALGSAGWAAFVTADDVPFARPLPVPVSFSAHWGAGARVVPMLRPLKLHRAAILCIAEARATRVFRYRRGRVERLESLPALERADGRAEAGALVDALLLQTSRDDWLLFGGQPDHAASLAAALPPRLARRSAVLPPLSPCAGEFEIAQAAERGVAGLRVSYEVATVDAVLRRSREGGYGVAGLERVGWALGSSAIEDLVLTRRFCERHPPEAEALAVRGFDHGAMVEEVVGSAAERLDGVGGAGALLREGYRTPSGAFPIVPDPAFDART